MLTVGVIAPYLLIFRLHSVACVPTIPDMDAGREQLRAWMLRAKLTQREAAKLLGIHYTFLSQILSTSNKRRSPALATAVTIERVTGVPVEAWMPTPVDAQRHTAAGKPVNARLAKRKRHAA